MTFVPFTANAIEGVFCVLISMTGGGGSVNVGGGRGDVVVVVVVVVVVGGGEVGVLVIPSCGQSSSNLDQEYP